MLEIKENVQNVEEFNQLYDEVGWGAYDNQITKRALENTFYSISVYDNDEIVGYGRIIGDTICFLYIQDIMVKPSYQGQKIGTLVMHKLLDKIMEIIQVYKYLSKKKLLVFVNVLVYFQKREVEEILDYIRLNHLDICFLEGKLVEDFTILSYKIDEDFCLFTKNV